MLSTTLLKSQSADSLLNSDMDTGPAALPPVAPRGRAWLEALGPGAKDMDTGSSSSHSLHRLTPETQDAFLSPLSNKGTGGPGSVEAPAAVSAVWGARGLGGLLY